MVETVLIMAAQHFVALQQLVAEQHQFGKIDHALALADFVVFGVTFDQAARVRVGGFDSICPQAAFLLRVDKALQSTRGDNFFGDVEGFQQAFDQRELVAAVENMKRGGQTRVAVVQAQKAVAQAVERAQPHRADVHRNHRAQTRLHFFGRLVGKRNRHNAVHTRL